MPGLPDGQASGLGKVEHEHATFLQAISDIIEIGNVPAEVKAMYCPDLDGEMVVPLLPHLRHHVLAQACGLSLFLLSKAELQGYLRKDEVKKTLEDDQFHAEKQMVDRAYSSLCTFILSLPPRRPRLQAPADPRKRAKEDKGGSPSVAKTGKVPRLVGGVQ
jgi:hypothetical protein